ncbi:MAG: ABC transporter substrate-binding protein, partial [Bacteroidota bacterium]|nr:ABC transporter substrate-binding protein [Bacteroidota bacterium]
DISENKVESLFESHHSSFDNGVFVVDRKPVMATDCYEFNLSRTPFNNIDVRKAFAHAINKNRLIDNVLKGQGRIGNKGIVPVVNTLKSYNFDTIKGYNYNPELAKEYLTKAGYPNGEGFPEVVLELTFGNLLQENVAKEVQNQLNNTLNISITIEEEKMSTLIDRAAHGKSQMNHFTWLGEYPSPMDFLNVFYGGVDLENDTSYSWPNTTRYRNKEYDAILEKALVTSDKENRFRLYEEAESILMNDVPVIILWYPEVYNVIYGNVHNLFFNEMLHFDFSCVYLN